MKKIFIVDDSITLRTSVKYFLHEAGFAYEEACDGKQAFEKISSSPDKYDMFIIDVNMPEMDGITLTSRIRELQDYRFTPILILTTEVQAEKKQEGKNAGASGWLVKPFDPEQLISIVRKFLKMS